ncbi:hypothetical protein FK535_19980 [Mycolicibacterium sp. 018/SC-01/001]|uniref:hypothetical protein n=1 Tax=Mycolicibacterium sp. 018/SC-01/001 TaxID=2592069 RepID=UPI00117FC264|nr:hypothetical protein [Mycolicibacterium sp. 018/SC-01/001]TRW80306.1 hypothetical protein FK535_19980 [Mycolicibacterium sp. 018/SC-01/001]
MAFHDCAFVITLNNRHRLTYGPGSHLDVHRGELTAVDAAGEERRVQVQEWEDVIVNAEDILTNRWRRSRQVSPGSTESPQRPADDDPDRTG